MFALAADASHLMLGQFVDDLNARHIGRYWLALTTALRGSDGLLFRVFIDSFNYAFSLVEQGQLTRRRIRGLLRLASEQVVA